MKPQMKYMCGECSDIHDEYDDAVECCQPDVSEVYLCGHCGKSYGSDEGAADECCEDVDPDAQPFISKAELEAAGQMRLGV